MALVRTERLNQDSGQPHGTGPFVTNAFTPSDNSLLEVRVSAAAATGTLLGTDLTISDSVGLTWTSRFAQTDGVSFAAHRIWTAPVTTGVSMTLTLDAGAVDIDTYHVEARDRTGYDSVTPIGGTASASDADGDGAVALTLSAPPTVDDEVAAFCTVSLNTAGTHTVTPAAGWTELVDVLDVSQFYGSQSQVRTVSTSTSVDWTDIHVGTAAPNSGIVCAMVVKAAAAVVGGKTQRLLYPAGKILLPI